MPTRVLLYTLVMVVLWGSHSPVATLTMTGHGGSPLSQHGLLFFKLLFAGGCLFVVILCTGRLREFRKYAWRDVRSLVFAGVFGYFLYYYFLFGALQRAQPEKAVTEAVFLNYLFPTCTLLASAAILRERLTVRSVVCAVVSLAGAGLVVSRGDFTQLAFRHPVVDLMAVAAAVSWGIFSALGRRRAYEPLTSLFIFILTGLVLAGCVLPFASGRHLPVGWEFYGAFHVGFVCNTVGVMLWFRALKEGGASLAGNLSLLAAFVSVVFIRLLLPDQAISPWAVGGLAVILLGVLFSRAPARRLAEPSQPASPPA
jgi:drug/metabolite transporter (DMT)-like permease